MRSVISPPFPRPRENEAEIARPKSAENDRPIRPLNSSGPKNDRDDLVGSWEKKSTSPCCPSLHRRFFATLSLGWKMNYVRRGNQKVGPGKKRRKYAPFCLSDYERTSCSQLAVYPERRQFSFDSSADLFRIREEDLSECGEGNSYNGRRDAKKRTWKKRWRRNESWRKETREKLSHKLLPQSRDET